MNQREEKTLITIKKFANKLPKFLDGRIDYSTFNIAPVITVFVKHEDKILLLKRSDKVRVYQGKWNTVAGYLDELKPIRKKVLEEIQEELGISKENIMSLHIGKYYKFADAEIGKTWLVNPVSVELKKKPDIKIDWEHTEYKWINPAELKKFNVVSDFERGLENAFK